MRVTSKKVKGLLSYIVIHSVNVKTATPAPAIITAPAASTDQFTVSDLQNVRSETLEMKKHTLSQNKYQNIANLQAKLCTLSNEIDSCLACDNSIKELRTLEQEIKFKKNVLKGSSRM